MQTELPNPVQLSSAEEILEELGFNLLSMESEADYTVLWFLAEQLFQPVQ